MLSVRIAHGGNAHTFEVDPLRPVRTLVDEAVEYFGITTERENLELANGDGFPIDLDAAIADVGLEDGAMAFLRWRT